MSIPRFAAVALVALLATACTEDVSQESTGTQVRAVFDPDRSLIPTPNDLLLQAAPTVLTTTTRQGLFTLIDAGGFVADPTTPGIGLLSVINVPFEFVTDGVASAATVAIDPATINSTTVAIVRVDVDPPVRFDPALATTPVPGAIQLVPAALPPYVPGARYVVAVRGGANGVKTTDGRSLAASAPMLLIANRTNLNDPEGRPATLTDEQLAALVQLQQVLTNPLDWEPIRSADTCANALGAPVQAFPEGLCWLPFAPPLAGSGAPGVPAAPQPPVPPGNDALSVVDLAFPVEEAISIQTFQIAPAP